MPGFSTLFDHLFDNKSVMAMARRCASPAVALECLEPLGIGIFR
jgi:hypothetical protein